VTPNPTPNHPSPQYHTHGQRPINHHRYVIRRCSAGRCALFCCGHQLDTHVLAVQAHLPLYRPQCAHSVWIAGANMAYARRDMQTGPTPSPRPRP
jgi:hypothetical protein